MPAKDTTTLLSQLRALMKNKKIVPEEIHAYIVPSSDAHNNEYIADCDRRRAFISGFTGTAGTAIITLNKACLWTDTIYYQQAVLQLDSNWIPLNEGLPDTPTQGEWLSKNLPAGSRVGVDPKMYTYHLSKRLQNQLESVGLKLVYVQMNLIDEIWTDRPARPTNSIYPLELEFTGKTVREKQAEVNGKLKEKKAKYLVVTALDEIAYFLNLRGSDIDYNPVFFSYLIISHNSFTLFLNPQQNSKLIRDHLTQEAGSDFRIESYDMIENILKLLVSNLDGYIWFAESASAALTSLVPVKNRLMTGITPICIMKSVKNVVERKGMRNCHIRDAVALCCYFAWLENNVKTSTITEISGAKKLLEFRRMQKDFMGESFATISCVGPHGAIIHYEPDKSTDVRITMNELYLCDSGGQYKDGTTDVTRTLHFGKPKPFEKECYTRVLKGQMKLANRIFPSRIKGSCLDSFAREFLWQVGLDYTHGTSHGIGSYLNVHEGPIGIYWTPLPDDPGLQVGMFLSNEPGCYQDGKFGIRIEDIVQIVEAKTAHNFNNRGFLTFETITLVPKGIKLIDVNMLTDDEIRYLNQYHAQCKAIIGPLLEQQGHTEALTWLNRETQPISR